MVSGLAICAFWPFFEDSGGMVPVNPRFESLAVLHGHVKITSLSPLPSLPSVSSSLFSGLRKGNEIMTLNGEAVSDLDLKQMEALFSEQSVGLTLIARPPETKGTLCSSWSDSDLFSRDQKHLLPPPNQSQLLEEFLDNFKKNTTNGKAVFFLPSSLLVSTADIFRL